MKRLYVRVNQHFLVGVSLGTYKKIDVFNLGKVIRTIYCKGLQYTVYIQYIQYTIDTVYTIQYSMYTLYSINAQYAVSFQYVVSPQSLPPT